MSVGRGAALAVLASLAAAGPARADDRELPADPRDRASPSVLWDRDALLLFWAPLFGTIAVDTYVTPRTAPLGFDPGEGGAEPRRDGEVPGAALTLGGALVATAIALGDDPARYHHATGLAESLATSGFLAVSAKRVFGRHRPDFDPALPSDDGRRSFPSGHSTRAVATLTYAALYLRHHGFDRWRAPGTTPWWEVASYVGLGALAVGLMGERVYHHRHHVSDVAAGGLLGAASSVVLFYYNERKFRRDRRRERAPMPPVEPAFVGDALADRPTVSTGGGAVLSFGGSF